MKVRSPCIDICRIDPQNGWCEGCLRTLVEIASWGSLDAVQQRAVWAVLPERRMRRDADAPRSTDADIDAAIGTGPLP